MSSFFKLAKQIETKSLQELCDEENEYEEVDENDENFCDPDKYKRFEQLVQNEVEAQNRHIKPYIQAILLLLNSDSAQESKLDVNEIDPESGNTILMKLVTTGKLDLVQTLVETGADVNVQTESGSFALLYAATGGWQEVFDYLAPLTNSELRPYAEEELPKGLLQRQRLNNHAVSAFVNAANCGNLQAVSEGIAKGIDINAINYNGYTALHRACWAGERSIVTVLLEAGANLNLHPDDNQGYPPLMLALDNPPFKTDIFQMLIDAGADVNCRSYDDITALMMAVDCGNLEAVQLLLKAGADINAKGPENITALKMAQANNNYISSEVSFTILNLLLKAGAIE
ncbi:ankyrin repeat domain-containing protein [Nostoc punctiforme FACHB-252]|uniref:Ankyrin repeat domain-containing protein n=1 Tax=Nostoc punctiforme FACHB-252 TaxID=1357509 RepID=A0ABR8HJL6_NOSPU|nr:ankyrin repeat domain-containing protein [Nostoc punctiforme]MBD2616035.1 ankyrin repeat domain-containing protein [Nostoc punctiforme FACHB-252]